MWGRTRTVFPTIQGWVTIFLFRTEKSCSKRKCCRAPKELKIFVLILTILSPKCHIKTYKCPKMTQKCYKKLQNYVIMFLLHYYIFSSATHAPFHNQQFRSAWSRPQTCFVYFSLFCQFLAMPLIQSCKVARLKSLVASQVENKPTKRIQHCIQ